MVVEARRSPSGSGLIARKRGTVVDIGDFPGCSREFEGIIGGEWMDRW